MDIADTVDSKPRHFAPLALLCLDVSANVSLINSSTDTHTKYNDEFNFCLLSKTVAKNWSWTVLHFPALHFRPPFSSIALLAIIFQSCIVRQPESDP